MAPAITDELSGPAGLPWHDRSDLIDQVNGRPRPTGYVYRFRDAAGSIVYVGKVSGSLLMRMRAHRRKNRTWPHVARIEVLEVPTDLLAALEAAEIHARHPVLNRVCPVAGCPHYPSTRPRRPRSLQELLRHPDADTLRDLLAGARIRLAELEQAAPPERN
jgi:hypothetical protein